MARVLFLKEKKVNTTNLLKIKENNVWLCSDDLARMDQWKSRINTDNDHNLTVSGRFYMKALGNRMRSRLFDIVSDLKSNQVSVQTTNLLRTQQSADEYVAGLLSFMPTSDLPKYSQNPPEADFLLKSPDLCQKYVDVSLTIKKRTHIAFALQNKSNFF